jgi:hypothetical protein
MKEIERELRQMIINLNSKIRILDERVTELEKYAELKFEQKNKINKNNGGLENGNRKRKIAKNGNQ